MQTGAEQRCKNSTAADALGGLLSASVSGGGDEMKLKEGRTISI